MAVKRLNPAAKALGSLGGQQRAANLSKGALSAIGKVGAAARWKGHVKKAKAPKRKAA